MRVPKNQQQIISKYYSKMAWQVVILTIFHEKKNNHQKYLILKLRPTTRAKHSQMGKYLSSTAVVCNIVRPDLNVIRYRVLYIYMPPGQNTLKWANIYLPQQLCA